MEQTENAEKTVVSENFGGVGTNGGKKKRQIKQKTLREWLFAYGMLLLPLIQFAIFYIWINANSIVMAFREFAWDDDGNEIYYWSMANFTRFFKEWSNPESVIVSALLNTLRYFAAGVIMEIGRAHV